MKRLNISLADIFTEDNLYQAFKDAKKSKRDSKECLDFECFLGYELDKIKNEVLSKTYTTSKYKEFIIYEPKRRVVKAPVFRDCVVQHAVYLKIYPHLEKSLIYQNHGCRKTKGFHSSSDYALKALRASSDDSYYLQLDISKYFFSIDHELLRKTFHKYFKNDELVEFLMLFVSGEIGVPIGNLLSQVYALIFLNDLDHFVKRELKVKYYVRFVDDFALFNLSLNEAKSHLKRIEKFLESKKLRLSKIKINKSAHGINFTGYLIKKSGKKIRKLALKRFKKALKKNDTEKIVSYFALAKNTLSENYLNQLAKER